MSPLGKLFPEENIESSDHIGVGVKITVFIMETRVFKWKIDNCPREVHTKLHPGLEWRIFHILTCDVISRSNCCLCTVCQMRAIDSVKYLKLT